MLCNTKWHGIHASYEKTCLSIYIKVVTPQKNNSRTCKRGIVSAWGHEEIMDQRSNNQPQLNAAWATPTWTAMDKEKLKSICPLLPLLQEYSNEGACLTAIYKNRA